MARRRSTPRRNYSKSFRHPKKRMRVRWAYAGGRQWLVHHKSKRPVLRKHVRRVRRGSSRW